MKIIQLEQSYDPLHDSTPSKWGKNKELQWPLRFTRREKKLRTMKYSTHVELAPHLVFEREAKPEKPGFVSKSIHCQTLFVHLASPWLRPQNGLNEPTHFVGSSLSCRWKIWASARPLPMDMKKKKRIERSFRCKSPENKRETHPPQRTGASKKKCRKKAPPPRKNQSHKGISAVRFKLTATLATWKNSSIVPLSHSFRNQLAWRRCTTTRGGGVGG